MTVEKTTYKRTVRETADFITFILDAEKNVKLTEEFIAIKEVKKLHSFFLAKGYKGIPEDQCRDILKAKNNWDKITEAGCGKPPCGGPKMGY